MSNIINKFKNSDNSIIITFIFFIVNLFQGIYTPLINDESYYWLYSKYLAWGYYDHPPLIAFIINIGTKIFSGEIGVRIVGIFLGALTIFLWCKIIEIEINTKINIKLGLLLLGSSIFININTFAAIPDTSLFFFEVLFLWAFQKYIKNDSWISVILLSIASAMLIYSKYHGILIIFFTILSNTKLLLKKSFYIITCIATVLLIPHIIWLIDNDFMTIRFHLTDRSSHGFSFKYVFRYLPEQFLVTGPIFLLAFSILYKTQNKFTKTLKIITIGTFLFFLISSFSHLINTHWTSIAWFPMLTLCYLYLTPKKINNIILSLLIINVLVVISFRLNIIFDWIPIRHMNRKKIKHFTTVLKNESENKKIVFYNTYIDPASYIFYQNENCYAFNDIYYKRTQFNFFSKLEKEVQNETVMLVTSYDFNNSKKISVSEREVYYLTPIFNFQSFFTSVKIIPTNWLKEAKLNQHFKLNCLIENNLTNNEILKFNLQKNLFGISFINTTTGKEFSSEDTLKITNYGTTLNINYPSEVGYYKCVLYVYPNHIKFLKGFNSNNYYVRVY